MRAVIPGGDLSGSEVCVPAVKDRGAGRLSASARVSMTGSCWYAICNKKSMSRIFLVHDLSPSESWLFGAVHANRALLAARGVELGPVNPWRCDLVPTHVPFWNVPEGGVPSPFLAGLLDELAHRLGSGRDVLLLSPSADPKAHASFARLLEGHPGLGGHEVRALFVFGRPVCILEQRWRTAANPFTPAGAQRLVRLFGALPELVACARRLWGADAVRLMANVSENPAATRDEALARQFFAELGFPEASVPERVPLHPDFLRSVAARRLFLAREVRENAWPPLDERAFLDTLFRLDARWGADALCPLSDRVALARDGASAQAELERILGLESGALDAPQWLLSEPETAFDAPLPEAAARECADALPEAARAALRSRFACDAPLLTSDQRTLAAALGAPEAAPGAGDGGFRHIGEPSAPVELTVLTMTYNHEKYIAECMESVLAQETPFPVRHLVLDHHSSDATPRIVADYAARHPSIRPVLLSQRRLHENVRGLFDRCRTKYAALCDGDDYFITPHKLRRQVDFLERHSDAALCFHPVLVTHEDGAEPGVYPPPSLLPRGVRTWYYLADLVRNNLIQTNSVVYRWRFTEGLPPWFRAELCPGDWYWHLLHAETGKAGFLTEIMSVYRRHAAALYADSYKHRLEHRRRYGMAELAAYAAVNTHFSGRYLEPISGRADDVFASFAELSVREDDTSLLDAAGNAYPEFYLHFLKTLKQVRQARPAGAETGKNRHAKEGSDGHHGS